MSGYVNELPTSRCPWNTRNLYLNLNMIEIGQHWVKVPQCVFRHLHSLASIANPWWYRIESEWQSFSALFPWLLGHADCDLLPLLPHLFQSCPSILLDWDSLLATTVCASSTLLPHTGNCFLNLVINFQGVTTAASSPFPCENDSFENDYGHHLTQT